MKLELRHTDLAPLVKGASFQQLFQLLYYASILKYTTEDHLKAVSSTKLATPKKLNALVELGYLAFHFGRIFTATPKARELLGQNGYDLKLLPDPPKGKGDINQLHNTDVFIRALKLPNFRALLFPYFDYLIPDALLVLAEDGRYQLNFLEVEASKPDWENYLADKHQKYGRLSSDLQVYEYWKIYAPRLSLGVPAIEDFRFQVFCVGDFKADWEGWIWKREI